MIKRVYHIFSLVITLFVIKNTNSQIITKNKVINLMLNEQYEQQLAKLYDFTAKSIEWPNGYPQDQISLPYKNLQEIQDNQQTTNDLAYFMDNNAKYMIGLIFQKNKNQNSTDIILSYSHILVDNQTKIIKREQILSKKVETLSLYVPTNFYGSMYSSTEGFVSYYYMDLLNSILNKVVFKFSFLQTQGLTFEFIPNIDLFYHASILGPKNVVYIIQFRFEQFQLYRYNNTEMNLVDLSQSYTTGIQKIVTDSAKYFIAFSIQNSTMYYSTIDFQQEQLIIKDIYLPVKFKPNPQVFKQRINDILIIMISDDTQTFILQLQSSDFLSKGTLKIVSQNTLPFTMPLNSFPTFIDKNTFVYVDEKQIYLSDISKTKNIFSQQLEDKTQIYKLDYFQNQFIFYLQQSESQMVYTNRFVQFNSPSIKIYGKQQTLNFTISSIQFPFSLRITLVISSPSSPLIIFSQTKVLISNQFILTPQSNQNFSVEQYVTGADLPLTVTIPEQSQQFIKNAKFVKVKEISSNQNNIKIDAKKFFQTDYYFASIVQTGSNNSFFVQALLPSINQDGSGSLKQFECEIEFKSEIDAIDNAGAFVLKQDSQSFEKTIYLPNIYQMQFYLNTISIKCDTTTKQFKFSSDPNNNVLFTLCGSELQMYNYIFYGFNDMAYIISQRILSFNATLYDSLICMRGLLLLSNETTITAYDYINYAYFNSNINIPKLSNTQQIILFKNSFLIIINETPIKTISQYSYNNFQSSDPIFLRNLQIDKDHQINSQLRFISVRNNIEYLFVETILQNYYLIYRISGDSYSQNQLYTTTFININDNQNIPIINSSLYCVLSNFASCTQIFENATIQLELTLTDEDFKSNLSFNNTILLKNGDQQQEYHIIIQRKAENKNMIIDQKSDTIQQLKSKFENTDWTKQVKFKFDDQKIMNTCILGWSTDSALGQINNRIQVNNITDSNTSIFTILYNQKVLVNNNLLNIMNLLVILGQYINCIVIDDTGSIKSNQNNQFTMDLYIFCSKQLIKYSLEITQNDKSQYTSVQKQSEQVFNSNYTYPVNIYSKILTFNDELVIFVHNGVKHNVIIDNINQTFYINPNILPYPSLISLNVIPSLNIQITFYEDGVLLLEFQQTQKTSKYLNIQDLLEEQNYSIDSCDSINTVDQYSFNQFRIAFTNSYIYDITFNLNQDSQLIISSVNLYYYRDSFSKFYSGFKGKEFTIFYGIQNLNYIINLYSDSNSRQNQYLIESTFQVNSPQEIQGIYYVEEVTPNQINIFFSKGLSFQFTFQSVIELQFSPLNNTITTKTFEIYPIQQQNTENVIQFRINPTPPSPPYDSYQAQLQKNIFLLGLIIIIFYH